MITLEQKTLLKKEEDKRVVGIPIKLVQVWNTNIVHVKEQRGGLQKCRPRGDCGFCVVTGRERTFLPPTASWKPHSPPPVGHTTSVCPSNNNVLLFFFWPSHIGEGFVMAKAFLYGEALLTFILQGELQWRGSHGIKPVIDKT